MCYCQPCVISEVNRQAWWPTNNADPDHGNSSLRKRAYHKFWAMLDHRGAWENARYREKKGARGDTSLLRQEIMPDCF